MPEHTMTTTLSSASAERLKQAFQHCRDMEGTLREQLEAYAAAGREIFPAYGEAVDRLVERLNENGGGESGPRPGDPLPPLLLPGHPRKPGTPQFPLPKSPAGLMF